MMQKPTKPVPLNGVCLFSDLILLVSVLRAGGVEKRPIRILPLGKNGVVYLGVELEAKRMGAVLECLVWIVFAFGEVDRAFWDLKPLEMSLGDIKWVGNKSFSCWGGGDWIITKFAVRAFGDVRSQAVGHELGAEANTEDFNIGVDTIANPDRFIL